MFHKSTSVNFGKESFVVFHEINKIYNFDAVTSMINILNTGCFLDIIIIFVSRLNIRVC